MAKRTLHKGTTRFISVLLSLLLVVNTLGLSAYAAEGTASTQQSVTASGLSAPSQDPAEESDGQPAQVSEDGAKERSASDSEDGPDGQPAQVSEDEPDEQTAQVSEDEPDEQTAQVSEDEPEEQTARVSEDTSDVDEARDSEDESIEEQVEAPVEQDEGVSREAEGAAGDRGDGDQSEMSAWASLQAEIDAAEDGATITVTDYIKAEPGDSALTIPLDKKIILDLKGTLDRGLDQAAADGSVIINKGDLTIKGGGSITGGNTTGDGGGIWNSGGSLTLDGVTIRNNHAVRGGGFYTAYVAIDLIDGEISENSANMGGGVYVEGGYDSIRMSGGSIRSNGAEKGGGVYVSQAEFLQSGGEISENRADSYGGGVFLINNTYRMTGGSIDGNETGDSGSGGGVYIDSGTFTMEDGTITGNESSSGGAVYIAGDTFMLAGGTITGNESDGGAIVPAGSSSKFCIGGADKINVTGNMIPHGEEFNVNLKSDRLITVEATPATGSQIGITTANEPAPGANVQNYVKFADLSAGVNASSAAGSFSSDAGFEVYDVGSSLYLRDNRIATWSQLQDALDNGGEAEWFPPDDPDGDWIRIIRLTDDITAGSGDQALRFQHSFDDYEIILDLRGHTIDRGLAGLDNFQSDGYVLHMDGGKLIIRDSVGGGAIKGGNSDTAGGVYIDSGTLTLEGGSITGNRAYDGGGVYIRDGELRQTGGSISGNSATEGGGVYIRGGVLQQTGGSISDNSALEGGGIYVQNSDTYKVSGTPVVFDNTNDNGRPCNVYLSGQATIRVTDILTDGAKLGIYSYSAHPVTSGYADYYDGEDPVDRYFFNDYLYYLYFDQNSEEAAGEVTHDMQPVWTWPEEDDGASVTLEMKCVNCGDVEWSEAADIMGPGAYSDEEGGFSFTAEAAHDGVTYSDTKYVAPEYVETAEPFMDGGGSLRNGMKEHYELKYVGNTYYYPVDGERPGEGPVDPEDFILEAYVVHLDPDNGTDESGIMICSGNCTLPAYEDVLFKVPVGTAFNGWKDESGYEHGPGEPVDLTSEETTFTAVWSSEWALVNSALQSGEEVTLRNDITDVIRVDGELNMSGGSAGGAKGLITRGYNSGDGGGIFVGENGKVDITDVDIKSNHSGNGGGIFVGENGKVDITDVDIKSNHSGNGAGLYLTLGGAVVLTGCAVMYNIASAKGGGAFVSEGAELLVNRGSQIVENVAQEGAGVYIKSGGSSTYNGPDVKVKNNTKPDGSHNNIQPESTAGGAPIMISGPISGSFLGFSIDGIADFLATLSITIPILDLLEHIIFDVSNKNDRKDQENPCDHPSRTASWHWNNNYSQADAALTCDICGQTINASDKNPDKSVGDDGVTRYTAHVQDENQDFVDQKTVEPFRVKLQPGERCHASPVTKIVPHGGRRGHDLHPAVGRSSTGHVQERCG